MIIFFRWWYTLGQGRSRSGFVPNMRNIMPVMSTVLSVGGGHLFFNLGHPVIVAVLSPLFRIRVGTNLSVALEYFLCVYGCKVYFFLIGNNLFFIPF